MQRLTRILQLSRNILSTPTAFHTRFEHSMGVFNRKKDVIKLLLQKTNFKKNVEDNNLKVYIIAELIKSAGHDIGHLPLSHVLELSLLHKPGFHEEIGKKILLETPELQDCYKRIHPDLQKSLEESFTTDIFGIRALDEGNFDLDRLDYLTRDSLYFQKNFQIDFPKFDIVEIDIDDSGNPIKNSDNSIVCSNLNNSQSKKICVFNYNSLDTLVNFLVTRINAYKNLYFSPSTQFFDDSISIFLNELQKHPDSQQCELIKFANSLNCDPSSINIDDYLAWDDITFYNNLISFIKPQQKPSDEKTSSKKKPKSQALQEFGAIILPPMFSLINMSYSLLANTNNTTSTSTINLSSKDIEYINNMHNIISGSTDIDKKLRSDKFKTDNAFVETNPEKIAYLQTLNIPEIIISSKTVKLYKPSEPIFVYDKQGKIYTLDSHPESPLAQYPSQETIYSAFTLKPLLELHNISKEQQDFILSNFSSKNIMFNTSQGATAAHGGIFTLSYPISPNTPTER